MRYCISRVAEADIEIINNYFTNDRRLSFLFFDSSDRMLIMFRILLDARSKQPLSGNKC